MSSSSSDFPIFKGLVLVSISFSLIANSPFLNFTGDLSPFCPVSSSVDTLFSGVTFTGSISTISSAVCIPVYKSGIYFLPKNVASR